MKELILDLHALMPKTADLEGCHIVPWIQFQCNCSLTGDWQPHPQPEWTLTVKIWIIIIKTLGKQSITTISTSLPIWSKQCTQHATSRTNCRKIFKRHRNQGVTIMSNNTRRQNCLEIIFSHGKWNRWEKPFVVHFLSHKLIPLSFARSINCLSPLSWLFSTSSYMGPKGPQCEAFAQPSFWSVKFPGSQLFLSLTLITWISLSNWNASKITSLLWNKSTVLLESHLPYTPNHFNYC